MANSCAQVVASLLTFLSIAHAISVIDLTTNLAVTTFSHCQLRLGFPTDFYLTKESLIIINKIASERQVLIVSFNASSKNFTGSPIIPMKRTPNCGLNVILVQTDQLNVERKIVRATSTFRKVGRRNKDYYVAVASSREHSYDILKSSRFMVNIVRKILVYPTSSINDGANVVSFCEYCSPDWKQNVRMWDGRTNLKKMFYDRNPNWKGSTLRILAFNSPSRLQVVEEPDHLYIKRGSHFKLLQSLSFKHNFTFKVPIRIPKKPSKTYFEDTLISGKVHVAMIATPTAARLRVVDFTTPIGYSWLTFVTAVVKPTTSWKTLIKGFAIDMWICVGASGATATMTVWILSILTQACTSNVQHTKWPLAAIAAFIMLSLIRHGPRIQSKENVVRIFLIFWLLYAMITCIAYESMLMSSLLFPFRIDMPNKLAELSSRTDVHIVFNSFYGAAHRMMSESTNPIYSTIFNKAELQRNTTACLEAVAVNAQGVCILYDDLARFYGYTNPLLHFEFSSEQTYFIQIAWMVRKNSMLTRIFDRVISSVVNMGLLEKWTWQDYESVRSKNFRNCDGTWRRRGSESGKRGGHLLQGLHLKFVFIALAMGVIFAAFILFIERMTVYFNRVTRFVN